MAWVTSESRCGRAFRRPQDGLVGLCGPSSERYSYPDDEVGGVAPSLAWASHCLVSALDDDSTIRCAPAAVVVQVRFRYPLGRCTFAYSPPTAVVRPVARFCQRLGASPPATFVLPAILCRTRFSAARGSCRPCKSPFRFERGTPEYQPSRGGCPGQDNNKLLHREVGAF